MIISRVIGESLSIFFNRVSVCTILSVPAITTLEIHTHFWFILLLILSLKEFFNKRIVLVIRVPLTKLLVWWFDSFWSRAYCLYSPYFFASFTVNNNLRTYLALFNFIILFKIVWSVVVVVIILLILLARHGAHLHCQVLDVLHHCCSVWIICSKHTLEPLWIHSKLLKHICEHALV